MAQRRRGYNKARTCSVYLTLRENNRKKRAVQRTETIVEHSYAEVQRAIAPVVAELKKEGLRRLGEKLEA